MKKVLLFIIIVFSYVYCKAQGLSNLWLTGYDNLYSVPFGGTRIDYQNGQMIVSAESRNMNFWGTNALISDANGELRFATNGVHIINANNDTMINGSGLNPCYYTTQYADRGLLIPQGAVVIPFSADSEKYYLFHGSIDDYGFSFCSLNLYYSIIDMSLDNGLGEVTVKNFQLLNDSLVPGGLTACKHANGRDWWLICHKFLSNKFYKYLITPNGINGPFTQDIGENRDANFGQNCFSPDGSSFAYYISKTGDLDIFNFDRCTGDFSLKAHVDIYDGAVAGGVAYSPNSKVLYVSSMDYLYQFDLTSSTLTTDFDTLAVYDGFYSPNPPLATSFLMSYLAPDGKIYINAGNTTLDMHVINNPDSLGYSANICQHCIHLPTFNAWTIPNYPNYFLGALSGSTCDSLVSINENKNFNVNFSVYPNPIENHTLNLAYPTQQCKSQFTIYDIKGDIVYKSSIPPWTSSQKIILPINISPGMYYIVVFGEKKYSARFIVN